MCVNDVFLIRELNWFDALRHLWQHVDEFRPLSILDIEYTIEKSGTKGVHWSLPPIGLIKVNVDVVFLEERVARVFIVHNVKEHTLSI